MIDLHTHSTFSDGSLTPEELVADARKAGLSGIALTDHDTTGGVERFLAACSATGVNGIAGVEISADISHGTMHLLGYHIDPSNVKLQTILREIRDGRESRNHKILAKLNGLGIDIKWDEVRAFAGEDVVGRLHFAQALLARGLVPTKDRAFEMYLGKGKPGYVERFKMNPADCIKAISDAGGVPVLAHPFTLDLDAVELRRSVSELRDSGLKGLETFYPEHSYQLVEQYSSLARELGLVSTGGSDFHGAGNPKISLGKGFGGLNVPDSILVELKALRSSS